MLPVANQDTLTSQRQIRLQPSQPESEDKPIFRTRASTNVENAIGKIVATPNTAYIVKVDCVDIIMLARNPAYNSNILKIL